MAFYDVVVLYEDAFEESKSGNDRGTFTVSRTLLAKSDTPNPSFVAIGTSTASWPGLGGEPIDQLNALRNFDGIVARCSSRKFSWYGGTENAVKIDMRYEGLSSYENTDSGGSEQPKTLQTATWRRINLSTSQISVPATDEDGNSFCNSAGDPIDGLESETSIAVVKYTNEYNPDPALHKVWDWLNYCNSKDYLGAKPYTLRVTGFSADFDDKTMLWNVALELSYNPKTWKLTYVDAGFHKIEDLGGGQFKRVAITDDPGNLVSQPVPLNGEGQPATIAAPFVVQEDGVFKQIIVDTSAQLSAKPYPEKDFNLMLADLRMY